MSATLFITCDELDEQEIQALTRDISNDINNEVYDAEAALAEGEAKAGIRGDPVTIGTIILTLIGSGGVAVTLINVLKAHIEKQRTVKFKIKGKNNEEVEIDVNNLNPESLDKVTKMVKTILGEFK